MPDHCVVCDLRVMRDKICCVACFQCFHVKCSNIKLEELDKMKNKFKCIKCVTRKSLSTSFINDLTNKNGNNTNEIVDGTTTTISRDASEEISSGSTPNSADSIADNLLNCNNGDFTNSCVLATTNNLIVYIDRKFEELKAELKREIAIRIKAEMEHIEERVLDKLSNLSSNISNICSDFQVLNDKYDTLSARCDAISAENIDLKLNISNLQNNLVASDAVISNIPNNIDAMTLIKNTLSYLNCEALNIINVFRVRSNTGKGPQPIIVKFSRPDDRVKLLRALAEHRKNYKRQLHLNDISLAGDANVFINECLSMHNRLLLNACLQHKRNKLLNSVFTLRGQVFVRVQQNAVAIKVTNAGMLNDIVGGIINA